MWTTTHGILSRCRCYSPRNQGRHLELQLYSLINVFTMKTNLFLLPPSYPAKNQHQLIIMSNYCQSFYCVSCDGRVVKALDLKSNGVSPRRFEPYSQRLFFSFFIPILSLHEFIDFFTTVNYFLVIVLFVLYRICWFLYFTSCYNPTHPP